MNRGQLFKGLTIVFLSYFFAIGGCGGGSGGGGGGSRLTIDDLVGTYELQGFELTCQDGSSFTDNDVYSYSGIATIDSQGYGTMKVQIEHSEGVAQGRFTVLDNTTVLVEDPETGETDKVKIKWNDPYLTTTFEGIVIEELVCKETDRWKRISKEVVTIRSAQGHEYAEDGTLFGLILSMNP